MSLLQKLLDSGLSSMYVYKREIIDNVTSMVGLENSVHFARYLRGIFDNR